MLRTLGTPLESGHLLGWHNLAAWARWAAEDEGSYIWRAYHRDEARYRGRLQTEATLADIYDLVASFAHMFASAHSKSKVKQPKSYPRPWRDDSQRIGRGAIPIKDFENWYYGG